MTKKQREQPSSPQFDQNAIEQFLDHLARLIARDHVRRSASQEHFKPGPQRERKRG